MKKMMLLVMVILAFVIMLEGQVQAAPAGDPVEIDAVYVGEDGFDGFDDDTDFSTTANLDPGKDLEVSTLSLLGGFGELSAWVVIPDDDPVLGGLTHRGARGLGILGGEQDDEIDNGWNEAGTETSGRWESMKLSFDEPVWISLIEVRSLYDNDADDDTVAEEAQAILSYNGTPYPPYTIMGVEIRDEINNGVAQYDFVYEQGDYILADEVILRIPDGEPTECAFARLIFYYDEAPTYSICGNKWLQTVDGEGGLIDEGPGEDWEIYLEMWDGDSFELYGSTLTNENGDYCFTELLAGDYRVSEAWYTGWTQVEPTEAEGWVHLVTLPDDGQTYYDFLNEEVVETGDEGCTPGFWKNNADKKGAVAWECYGPEDLFSEVFGQIITIRGTGRSTITDPTLLQALGANGSGINLLARSAVAALLNAANTNINYAMSVDDVLDAVYDVLDEGTDEEIQALGSELDEYNNAGCPINQDGDPIMLY
ncbi:MAG: carboxypeptidase regulatory-like domain-containing protein [Sedimentisphaerales bacterium]|nr:carboxypeptidase regulatory-like domain-containing protein [Sedimentisphaerales bacterium]